MRDPLSILKDRQQERTAVLTRSHLKALCAFAPYTLYVNYICVLYYHIEGTVSQIFYLGLSFCFMKFRKLSFKK